MNPIENEVGVGDLLAFDKSTGIVIEKASNILRIFWYRDMDEPRALYEYITTYPADGYWNAKTLADYRVWKNDR